MAAKVRNMLPFDPTDEDQLPGPEDLHTMKVLLAEISVPIFMIKH
jgi:hypothetical protein